MLRDSEVVTALGTPAPSAGEQTVGVSAGTAAVLNLRRIRQADAPTTAYLMLGEQCCRDCTFCAQARSSAARAHFLSRIAWPPYPTEQALHAVARSYARREILRCCLQVINSPGYVSHTLSLVRELGSLSPVPICTSIALSGLDHIRALLQCGVERVTLALDAACERVYLQTKGNGWQQRLGVLRTAAGRFPGHIGTHLIAGLGETEREMSMMLQDMIDRQVSVGLFAFTPVPGTAWDKRPPPLLSSYRRIQAARYLMLNGACRVSDFEFSPQGQIVSYGLNWAEVGELLANGRAFQTAGCPGCNRPYYNERPGHVMYNYPRWLSAEETDAAIALARAGWVSS
jgi:biotin synthase-related radical SAM superfamily protein